MDGIRVRMYNVRFGDAALISIPDRGQTGHSVIRHILIDVGNAFGGDGGQETVFKPVLDSILQILGGQPLDLYVMTHEHMDHVKGLLYLNRNVLPNHDLKERLRIRHAWLTASSMPSYYDNHPEARKKMDEARAIYAGLEQLLAASPEALAGLEVLMANNNPRNTLDCVDFIRSLAEHTWYIHRESDLSGKHTFQEAHLEVWAPEEDTSVYYGAFQPIQLGLKSGQEHDRSASLTTPLPPSGVDAGAFYSLVASRASGCIDNLLAIDKAANNTSLVLCLEWRGWRLLFPGDAELRSWKQMGKSSSLKPIHFLKAAHHGSANGTPQREILERILPTASSDGRPRSAAVSTFLPNVPYEGVPDPNTLQEIQHRCRLEDVRSVPYGSFIDISFPG